MMVIKGGTMTEGACYENYPGSTVVISNSLTFAIYALGLYILSQAGLIFGLLFLVFILGKEYSLLFGACRNCWYYGRTCMSGRGRIAAIFFKKGDNAKFSARDIGWKDLMSDILLFLIPLVAAIALMVMHFSLWILAAALLLLGLATMGNGYVRGKLACAFCKQRELGCPAQRLFEGKGKE
jgi:hypothetical protein